MPALRRPFFLLGTLALAASAAAAPAAPDETSLIDWLEPQVADIAARQGFSRFEITPGRWPASLSRLAPCERAEYFLPPGMRGWGRASVGMRCLQGARWTVMLPVTVATWGPAWVAARALPAGAQLAAEDLQQQEVELTLEPAAPVGDVAGLEGRTLLRTVPAGQPLRLDMTRATPVVQAGDPVRLRVVGSGFQITSSGQALGSAGAGQSVRVRTEAGKVLSGVAREGRVVEIAL
ncbi:flagellar basal body P-ring formation protein FlgA [Ramlibacter sp. AW1]|uniref:Flagella basal body P-ring formation protein FlgA n=1 Tax=Ramlibacter aurantiacus TaxID=2801330 RepID=A0A937D8R4_9BURK|nr:flagellar basal body P-ring formation chaperone FlgA [Ramlibacter aurantiacus]MBL0423323.1 flagellar basal body P-ring formation protein FlgA [Ramlibacter aurantiacus]